jgi:zinc transport system substrate-binding protein
MRIISKAYLIIFILFIGHSVSGNDKVPVFVSIVPQKYFLQQIGKDLVDVHVMVDPGASPATYEPKPGQMARVSKTRVYFAIGVPFENTWLKKIAAVNPEMKVVHTDNNITKISMATDRKQTRHGHYDKAHERRGIPDPHIWLCPRLVKIQARAILKGLQEIDPSNGSVFMANYNKFVSDIDRLDTMLKNMFADKQGLRFMVFHPAWGYFATTYGLEQVPVEIEGKSPKPAMLKKLIKRARTDKIKVVFVQPQFSTKSAALVAKEIRGQVAVADPLAEDWLKNMYQVADRFKAALK